MLPNQNVSRHGVQPSTPGGIAGAIAGFVFYQWWATSQQRFNGLDPHGLYYPQLITLAFFIGLSFRFNRQGNLTRFIFTTAMTILCTGFAVGIVVQHAGLITRTIPLQEADRELILSWVVGLGVVSVLFNPDACDFANKMLDKASRGGAR